VEARIRELPESKQGPLLALVQETVDRYEHVKESADGARSALADLRVVVKYMLFDAEATEREEDASS